MRTQLRGLLLALLIVLLLAACTRERPTPEPSLTVEPAVGVTATLPAVAEPSVVQVTEAAPTADATATPEPEEEPETFQYIVKPDDTLLEIALEFGTDTATIRALNNLFSDEIGVGQPLRIPYVEGIVVPGAPTPTPGPFVYTVQPGDTIGSIAIKFGKDMIELIEANALIESDILSVGQDILIPDYTPTTADQISAGTTVIDTDLDGLATHVVQAGETLSDVAALFGVDEASLARANNIANPNLLRVGQVLTIPGLSARDAAALRGEVHVVQSGESLSQIAAQYGLEVDDIITANGLNNPNEIYVGQELIIPQ